EVVLPGEPAPLRDRAVQREPDPDGVLDRGPVRHGQRPGQAQAHRAEVGVGLAAERGRAAAEQLGPGAQLDVRLQADQRIVPGHCLVIGDQPRGRAGAGHQASPFAAFSSGYPLRAPRAAPPAAPTRYIRSSASTGAMICRPTGRPSSGASPQGTDSAALPARSDGIVNRSARYIAIGSSTRSPSGNAVVGVVGDTSTATRSEAGSKSLMTSVRTCCALP